LQKPIRCNRSAGAEGAVVVVIVVVVLVVVIVVVVLVVVVVAVIVVVVVVVVVGETPICKMSCASWLRKHQEMRTTMTNMIANNQ
jgi:Flp pilus assembly protein TadB